MYILNLYYVTCHFYRNKSGEKYLHFIKKLNNQYESLEIYNKLKMGNSRRWELKKERNQIETLNMFL